MFIERLPRTYELQFLDEAQQKMSDSDQANSFIFEENLLNIYYFMVQLYYRTDYDLWFLQEIQYHYALPPSKMSNNNHWVFTLFG